MAYNLSRVSPNKPNYCFPGGFFERGNVRLSNLWAKLSRQIGQRVRLLREGKNKSSIREEMCKILLRIFFLELVYACLNLKMKNLESVIRMRRFIWHTCPNVRECVNEWICDCVYIRARARVFEGTTLRLLGGGECCCNLSIIFLCHPHLECFSLLKEE